MTLTGLVSQEYIALLLVITFDNLSLTINVCFSGVVEVVGKRTELHDYMLSIIHGMKYLVSL